MKKFKMLIEEIGIEKVFEYATKNEEYKEFSHYIPYVFEQLEKMEPVDSEGVMAIEEEGVEGFEYWDAFLLKNEIKYSLDWTPWEEVLGTDVDVESVKNKVEIENFILSVLYNITFDGVDYQERNTRIEKLEERFKE